MVGKCIDYRDQTTQNAIAVGTGPTVNFDGEYTINQIDVFANELAQNILDNANKNPISIAVNKYGDRFYEAIDYLNGDFLDRVRGDLGNYPEAERRWSRGNITTLEVADFLDAYNYTAQGIFDQNNYLKLLREINNYYKDSFATSIMGGFCNTLKNIFAQIDAFYDLIGTVEGIINDALAILDKIRNFDGFPDEIAEQGLITFLIKEIKKKITDTINQIITDIEDAIANFNVENIIGDYTQGSLASVKAIMTAKEQMCALFTEDNKKTIRDRVNGFIDYAVSLFTSPSLEQIRYMVFRFCALATNIEALFKDIKRPLDEYGLRFQRIAKRMEAISNINTSSAIRAGAIRYSPEKRQESINRLRALWSGESGEKRITPTGEEPVTVAPITAAEYKDLPICGKVFKGADARIKLEGDWVEDLGITGYTRIDLDVKVYLMRVHKEIGGTFTITRGWYSKDYNEKLEGDPENSHLSGLVIDIKNDGFDTDAFVESALRSGFKYVVVNDDQIHLDIREVPR